MKDVKGYYQRLGVADTADAEQVKRAYRERVKETHPDSSGGTGDPVAFQAVQEAYTVIGSAAPRAEYDALCSQIDKIQRHSEQRRASAARERAARQQSDGSPPKKPKTQASQPKTKQTAGTPKTAKTAKTAQRKTPEPRPTAQHRPGDVPLGFDPEEPVRCVRCEAITAQPRYVVYIMVIGLLFHSLVRRFEGVYCRDCADRIAIGTSIVTWVLGWWSLPRGPIDAVKALVNNLIGGEKPALRNARLLTHQAKYFARRGEQAIAGKIAIQANDFKRDPALDTLIDVAQGHRLRDRWSIGGVSFVIQALPLGLLIAFALLTGAEQAWRLVQNASSSPALTSLLGQEPEITVAAQAPERAEPSRAPVVAVTDAPANPEPVMIAPPPDNREIRYVTVRELIVRAGPGEGHEPIGSVPFSEPITVVGNAESSGWLRVETPTGIDGFVNAHKLTPGPAARMIWCAQNAGSRPESGEILQRSGSGDHSLGLTNQASSDALVKLRGESGNIALTMFVRATDSTVVTGVPDGNFSVEYATGAGFSRRCNIFVDRMEVHRFSTPVSFATVQMDQFRMSRKVDLVLPQRGGASDRFTEITVESFQR